MRWFEHLIGQRIPKREVDLADAELVRIRAQAADSLHKARVHAEATVLAKSVILEALPNLRLQTPGEWSLDSLHKSVKQQTLRRGKVPEGQAYRFDPLDPDNFMSPEHLITHPGTYGIDFGSLRRMGAHPITASIIGTRINQIAEFSVPQVNRQDLGYRIVLRDRRKKMSKVDKQKAAEISDWLWCCGDPRLTGANYTFEVFLRELMRDSLTFDQACAELVPTKNGKDLAGFFAVDAATIRRVQLTPEERAKGRYELANRNKFVQVVDNQVVATFENDNLLFGIRRPRTEMAARGYGYPELETAMVTLGRLIAAELYNAANFTNGMHASGIVAVMSAMDNSTFKEFSEDFRAGMSGPSSAHRTALLQLDPKNKEEIKHVNMSSNNKEMEFMQWYGLQMKIIASSFQMDPAELGFLFGNEGQSASLSQSGPAGRVLLSKERGLRPSLRAVQSWINSTVMPRVNPDYMLEMVGLDAEEEAARVEQQGKKVKTYMTPNEIRAEEDLPPLDDPAADMIMDPTYASASQQAAAAAAQAEAEGGEGGEGGQPPEDDSGQMTEGADEEGFEPGFDFGSEDDPDEAIDFGSLFGGVAKGWVAGGSTYRVEV